MARKGGVPKDRVINALSLHEFAAYLNSRKQRKTTRAKPRRRSIKPRGEGAALAR
jgi:hypothetical protein